MQTEQKRAAESAEPSGKEQIHMNIAVYCGTSFGNDTAYREGARELGLWIARNNHTLVFGGGNIGLMGVLAEAVFQNGGHVIGVLPGDIGFIVNRPQPFCTEIITEPDMAARKRKMLELADAYIALPGGIGTLDEITEAMTLIKIGYMHKPAVLFNINGYYDPFRNMLDRTVSCGFMEKKDIQSFLFSGSLDEISDFIHTFPTDK